jgi:glycosyltransferase involved in cell wall biosynthesis
MIAIKRGVTKGVLFFSSDDWESGLKTSKYHMATMLANDGFTVLYINSIGLRRQNLGRGLMAKIWSRLRVISRGVREVEPNIHVLTPLVIPFHGRSWARALNRWLLVQTIRRWQKKLGMEAPELWLFLPNHADMPGKFNESVSVYYVVDEHALFEGVDSRAMQAFDDQLVRNSDLVVVTARSLYDARLVRSRRILYLPHGVDVAHFRGALDAGTPVPGDIAALPGPVIGFFGLIEEWIDLALVASIARLRPEWSFVMIGKVAVDIDAYAGIKNLHFLGPKLFSELPGYCKGFACGMLPFRITDMTQHVNPLKLREYLAAGLPVISTDLPEVRPYVPFAVIVRDADSAAKELDELMASRADRSSVSRLMEHEGWESRYRTLRSEIQACLAANAATLLNGQAKK